MSIFRRNDKDEEEEDRLSSDKSKKDAESKSTSRKKKTAPEPWTKKERSIVFYVLLGTIIISIILAFSARSWKMPGLPKISLPSFRGGPIIIEKDKTELDDQAKAAINEFKETTKKLSGVYGLYVIRLNDGTSYGVNDQEIFEPASLNKLPVMLAMYLEAEEGSLDLEEVYTLKDSDKIAGSGSLYGKPEGYELSYRDILRYMGQESDNTAVNIARALLGEEKISQATERMEMENTEVLGDDQKTTLQDIGKFFEILWNDDVISKKNRNELVDYLTDTTYEEWLAAGIPSDVDVAHKYGREIHIVNDAGIVFADDPFVLVLLSKGVVEREADQIFPDLAEIIYRHETE